MPYYNVRDRRGRFAKARAIVKDAISRSLSQLGQQAFTFSQQRCPVDTGKLRSSGRLRIWPDGFSLNYDTPYTQYVEAGTREGLRVVRPYIRHSGVHVKGYRMWSRGQKATWFISSSINDALDGLADQFETELYATGEVAKVVRR